MYTVCTNCKTKFRVSSAQLKAADGKVRCGKCHEVFDAFWALEGNNSDPQPVPTQEEPETTPNLDTVSPSAAPPPELDTIIRAKPARKEKETEPKAPELPITPLTEYPLADTPSLKAGPRKGALPIDDMFGDIGHVPDDEPEMKTDPPTTPMLSMDADPAPERPQHDVGVVFQETHEEYPIPAEDLPQHPAPRPRRPGVSALWWLGIAIMALVLALQLVNADREALAQNPVIGTTLQALYGALGRPLTPPRSVSDWDVSGLNVTSDPQMPGVLSITGTLQNLAGFVQPWPFLRVQLTDRFGQALRGRDFTPADYLPANQARSFLAAGQAVHFRIDIADPGADAVGFTLSPCLDLAVGRVCSTSEHD
ncbi:MAG TPA: DUF3426 domain-containing protein [Gammaproteobacteria bacterium]|nr:DUF3426 domain-containing protein [Gammaproteobacteria bacterium]